MARLIEIEKNNISVGSESTVYVPLVVYYHKYDLRTLWASSEQDIQVLVYDNEKLTPPIDPEELENFVDNGAKLVYESLVGKELYDLCNVPLIDKSGYSTIHLYIKNKSDIATNVDFIIKITNLL